MANQIEATKVVQHIVYGLPSNAHVSATKVVAYMILEPNGSAVGDTTRQGHVHTQIIRR